MTYYIQDSTAGKYVIFGTVPELVTYLEGMVQRAHNLTRKQYMQNLIDLGYGYDDPQGVTFTRQMGDQFNIGIVRNGNYLRTDIHSQNAFTKEEFGSDAVHRFENRGKF